jgi:hypothetical protein
MYDDQDEAELAERRTRQDTARDRHARNLAAVGALLALEAEASATPWRAQRVPISHGRGSDVAQLHQVSDVPDRGFYMLAQGELWGPDAALVAVLRNTAGRRLAAQLRTLERHRPNLDHLSSAIDCSHCIDAQENPEPFPCADYLDAEDGLVMPHRCTVSVVPGVQRAAVVCVCCGWSRTFSFARKTTGAPVAERLAEVWARRHLEGDPAAQLDAAAPAYDGWAERLAAARAAALAAPPLPSGGPDLSAFRPLVAELRNDPTPHRHEPGRHCPQGVCRWPSPGWDAPVGQPPAPAVAGAYCVDGTCGRTPNTTAHLPHPLVPLADENHWDVACEDRPHCRIAAHHSIDG